jgi:hypothetical protein
MALSWRQAGLLRVERRPPVVTGAGKILHLHRVAAPRGEPSSHSAQGTPSIP